MTSRERLPGDASPGALLHADDATFNRLVLKAPATALAVLHAAWCPASQACLATLDPLATAHAAALRVVAVDVEQSPGLAEQLAVWALPTYLAFRDGEELARACGFLPAPLLRLFADAALGALAPLGGIWHPSEQQVEDAFVLPLLRRWGLGYRRQEPIPGGRGRADVLVLAGEPARPLTLLENKRCIAGDDELRRAMLQASGYARALGLRAFVVAHPGALFVYELAHGRARLVEQAATYDLESDDTTIRDLLLQLAAPDTPTPGDAGLPERPAGRPAQPPQEET